MITFEHIKKNEYPRTAPIKKGSDILGSLAMLTVSIGALAMFIISFQ
jgi:hypothetical protein